VSLAICGELSYYQSGLANNRRSTLPMSLDERIDALKAKHQALETEIEEEANRPCPDDIHIASLKKQKLKIKDEIAVLSHQ
jgi:hypothetical protein